MFVKNKKHMMLAAAAAIVLPATVVSAATTTIDAVAVFRQAITLTPVQDMDFGAIEFSGMPTSVNDSVTLATNGAQSYGAGVFSGSASGTPGSVLMSAGTDGLTVEVSCDASAIMSNGSGATIHVNQIEIAAENATAAAGGANACAGIGTPSMTFALALGTFDNLILGGTIDGSTATAFVPGSYSTGFAGGNDIEIEIVYQ